MKRYLLLVCILLPYYAAAKHDLEIKHTLPKSFNHQNKIFHIETLYDNSKAMGMITRMPRGLSQGTGFVYYDKTLRKKYIITCLHVVAPSLYTQAPIYIRINSKKHKLNLIGGDTFYDIAVLSLEDVPFKVVSTLKPLKFATTFHLNEPATALLLDKAIIGKVKKKAFQLKDHPFSWSSFRFDKKLIKGNSGCPILNQKGEVIGIGNRVDEKSTYALKSSTAKGIITQLIQNYKGEYTTIKRAYLGFTFYQNKACNLNQICTVKARLIFNSPAEKVLKKRANENTVFILTHINNIKINNLSVVLKIMENVKPKESVRLKFKGYPVITITTTQLGRSQLTQITNTFFENFTNCTASAFPLKLKKDSKDYSIYKCGLYQDTGEQSMYIVDNFWMLGLSIRLCSIHGRFNVITRKQSAKKIDIWEYPKMKKNSIRVLFY